MDPDGFVSFDVLEQSCPGVSRNRLMEIIAQDAKGRYEVRAAEVRAVNGHSVHFCDNYEVIDPPEFLYHATNDGALPLILGDALKRMGRHYIHMYDKPPAKTQVRYRILRIRPPKEHAYYRTKNGYILCRQDIPAEYLEILN
uniref:2'-phosphotransferase n=1 Tax=Anopheles atroparvus TaxID=41427 RepID=A0A182J3Q6_ANOAO